MALLTSGITTTCDDEQRRGGIKSIKLGNIDEITSFTAAANHSYSAVTMVGTAVFYEFEALKFSAAATGESTRENGSVVNEITIEFMIPKIGGTKAATLQQLIDSCGIVAAVTFYNGEEFIYGYDEVLLEDAELEAAVGTILEAELQGQNAYSVSLTGVMAELPREFTGTIPT